MQEQLFYFFYCVQVIKHLHFFLPMSGPSRTGFAPDGTKGNIAIVNISVSPSEEIFTLFPLPCSAEAATRWRRREFKN